MEITTEECFEGKKGRMVETVANSVQNKVKTHKTKKIKSRDK